MDEEFDTTEEGLTSRAPRQKDLAALFPALDTIGLLKCGYAAKSGCGVPPQTVLGASRHQYSCPPPQVAISPLVRKKGA